MTAAPLVVLVPDDVGLDTLRGSDALDPIRYRSGEPWPSGGQNAAALVVGHEDASDVGARIADLPGLRLVQTLSAGYDQWLSVLPEGVLLSNARGAHGGSSAEWVVAALLAIYRQLVTFDAHRVRGVWRPTTTDTLIGKRIVVLGAGDLAVNLAARLTPFETEVILVGRHARNGVRALDELDDLLPTADVVVSMLPGGQHTHHVIDAAFLAKLADGAVVVNVGRGGAVDTDALLAELTSGRLRAALDVTDPEPLPAGHPLWAAPGLLLTPHVGGATAGHEDRAWAVARQQLEAYARGARPPNLVAGPGISD